MSITKKQTQLCDDMRWLNELLRLSPDISNVEPSLKTSHLEYAFNQLVRLGVLANYLIIDELLSNIVCRLYFPRRSFIKLWKTKKFKNFNYYILENIYLIQKANLIRSHSKMPTTIFNDIQELNSLRNAIAHSFFPENRRIKPVWKKKDIFTKEGFDSFWEDTNRVSNYLMKQGLKGYF